MIKPKNSENLVFLSRAWDKSKLVCGYAFRERCQTKFIDDMIAYTASINCPDCGDTLVRSQDGDFSKYIKVKV